MGHPAGVKFDRVKSQQRRMQAARLLQRGVSEAEVARRVGVHRQSVNRWAQQLAKGGRQALKRAMRTGRPPKLSAADRKRLERGLKRGPDPGAALSLQLEDAFGDCGNHVMELLLQTLSGGDQGTADHRVPGTSDAASAPAPAGHLGRAARLRARAQSRGVYLELPQTT